MVNNITQQILKKKKKKWLSRLSDTNAFSESFFLLIAWVINGIWVHIIFCYRGCPVYYRIFSPIPGLHLLDARNMSLHVLQSKMSSDIANCSLGGQNIPSWEPLDDPSLSVKGPQRQRRGKMFCLGSGQCQFPTEWREGKGKIYLQLIICVYYTTKIQQYG